MRKKVSWLNIALTVLLLVLFGAFLVGVMLWEEKVPAPPATTAPELIETASAAPETTLPPPTTMPTETTLPAYEARRINILLVGRDWHDEGENGRSDSMILCSFDTESRTVTMISFLRDIYLRIPGHGSNRLNAAYSWGGRELLNETLTENFGVQMDVNIEIDFDGFEAVIDHLGGVEIELTEREASYLNRTYDWALSAGVQLLNGETALAYSRIRFIDSDFVRTERQRNVLTSLMQKYRTAGIHEILNATDAFLDECTSSHADEELLDLVWELYPLLSECDIRSHQIPEEGTYSFETIRGMSVIEIDFEDNRALIEEWIGPKE